MVVEVCQFPLLVLVVVVLVVSVVLVAVLVVFDVVVVFVVVAFLVERHHNPVGYVYQLIGLTHCIPRRRRNPRLFLAFFQFA